MFNLHRNINCTYFIFILEAMNQLDSKFLLHSLNVKFSNSLIIQQVIRKEIITVTVVWKSDLN